jgi:GntP family gluconate:H+ symporter
MEHLYPVLWIFGSVLALIILTSKYKVHAFIVLFLVSLILALATMPLADVLPLMKEGFGKTIGNIGFLIISGSFIAIILEKTGAASIMAKWFLLKLGHKNAPLSLGMTGFFSGLLLFCDTGFILLSSLTKGISEKSNYSVPFLNGVLAISLFSVHCLTPTHPGMLGAIGIIPVDFGQVLFFGSLLALPGLFLSYQWLKYADRKWSEEITVKVPLKINTLLTEEEHLPVFKSFLPILLPLFLLFIASFITIVKINFLPEGLISIFLFIGQAPVSLSIGALISVYLLKNRAIPEINTIMERAIEKAGSILVITACGGVFGLVIKELMQDLPLNQWLGATGLGLFIPFLIASFLKIAQGSSTIAVLTTAALISPMLETIGMDSASGQLMVILAMGSGSMVFSHANDSYFWVITQFSGISSNTTLRYFSTASFIMGITSMATIFLINILFY